jgi:hypothetical protein
MLLQAEKKCPPVGLEALAFCKPVLAFGDSVYSNKVICLTVYHQREIYPYLSWQTNWRRRSGIPLQIKIARSMGYWKKKINYVLKG